jgi:hypothetical protein
MHRVHPFGRRGSKRNEYGIEVGLDGCFRQALRGKGLRTPAGVLPRGAGEPWLHELAVREPGQTIFSFEVNVCDCLASGLSSL